MDVRVRRLAPGIPQNLLDALAAYEKAARLDPNSALAWVGLSEVADLAADYDRHRMPDLLRTSARAVEQCIRIDPKNAKAWEMLANIRNREWRFLEAKDACAQALRLNPHAPYAMRSYVIRRGWVTPGEPVKPCK